MSRIVVVAIKHPTLPLYLHGLRRDEQSWTLPGGHANDGETTLEAAYRELDEETGIKIKNLENVKNKTYQIPDNPAFSNDVYLYIAESPVDLEVDSHDDPDSEMCRFRFLDPRNCDNLHVPKERNILVEYLNGIEKMEKFELNPEYTVRHKMSDKFHSNPKEGHFVLSVHDKQGKIARMYVMHRDKGITGHNLEIADGHDKNKVFSLLKHHAELLSGKPMVPHQPNE